jgi:hypothetical protein
VKRQTCFKEKGKSLSRDWVITNVCRIISNERNEARNEIYTSQIESVKFIQAKTREGEIYTSQDKSDWNLYKVCMWMGRNLYKSVQIRGLYKKWNYGKGLYKKLRIIVMGYFLALTLPIYAAEACEEFGAVCFVMCDAVVMVGFIQ